MKYTFVVLLTVSFLFGGCSKRPQQQVLPEITSESEEGFFDLVFGITEHKELPDGSQTILAFGMHSNRQIGLEIALGSSWQQSSPGGNIPFVTHTGKVSYRSIGVESDLLLQVLDQLYETRQAPKTMNRETDFTGIALEGDPQNLAKGPVKIKLFFESDAEDRYAELYTNIDLKVRKLYISEKDEEYRASVVRALKSP